MEELDRCWEVTQDQERASKIEKDHIEIQRDVKMETTFMSYVACALVLECPLPCHSLLLFQVPLPPLPIPAMVPDENSMEDPLCNSSFGSMADLDYVHPTHRQRTRSSMAGDLVVAENWQGGWPLRQPQGESWTAAEVVMDDALVQDDAIDLIVEELDRCSEVTQDQEKASKIGKALFETQRDVTMETIRTWHGGNSPFNKLENALRTPLPAVIKGYATLRDAELAESSYDKVVMWTGGSHDNDDVVRTGAVGSP